MRISFWRDAIGQKQIPIIFLVWSQAVSAFKSFAVFWVESTVFPIKKPSDNPLVAVAHVYRNVVRSKITMRENNLHLRGLCRIKLTNQLNEDLTARMMARE